MPSCATEWISLSETSSIFINTTTVDNTPVSVIEAMALGVPVISTNCGGMEELIDDEKQGFIVPVRDVNAIANKILKVVNLDSFELSKICQNALEKVKQQHNNELMIKGMESLYSKVYERN